MQYCIRHTEPKMVQLRNEVMTAPNREMEKIRERKREKNQPETESDHPYSPRMKRIYCVFLLWNRQKTNPIKTREKVCG